MPFFRDRIWSITKPLRLAEGTVGGWVAEKLDGRPKPASLMATSSCLAAVVYFSVIYMYISMDQVF